MLIYNKYLVGIVISMLVICKASKSYWTELMIHDVRCTLHDQFCNKLKFNIFKLVHTKGVQDVIILNLYVFTFFESKSVFLSTNIPFPSTSWPTLWSYCNAMHYQSLFTSWYGVISLHVIMSLKLVMFVRTAITTLNLPFASSDIMAFSEIVSVYKWREGVLCGSCCIETVNDNLLVNGIFTFRTVFLQFECRRTPQDICLHFISKQ